MPTACPWEVHARCYRRRALRARNGCPRLVRGRFTLGAKTPRPSSNGADAHRLVRGCFTFGATDAAPSNNGADAHGLSVGGSRSMLGPRPRRAWNVTMPRASRGHSGRGRSSGEPDDAEARIELCDTSVTEPSESLGRRRIRLLALRRSVVHPPAGNSEFGNVGEASFSILREFPVPVKMVGGRDAK